MAEQVRIEKEGAFGSVVLNRPEKHNAFDERLMDGVTDAFRALGTDPAIRVIILRAAGKSFSAGADLTWMQRSADYSEAENRTDAERLATMLRTIDTVPKPVIAAVQGPVYGGGLGLVAACDIAIGSDATLFSISEVRFGLIPAVIGPYVVRAIGMRAARRYAITAERFDAATAERIGLLHEVVPLAGLHDRVTAIANQLCENAPGAQAEVKALLRAIEGRPLDPALGAETAGWIARVRAGEEAREGIAAFLGRRRASWNPGDR
ncbi:MAG: enoyl-CoA hydratase/isomerase family protein [Rhodospirillaceae bacterium]|nr:enoyl-CoA hydratase/isomerase family protein [Rhodospirillaceae bacterium]